MDKEEESQYNVSIPFYKFKTTARVSAPEGKDRKDVVENIETLEDVDEVRYETSGLHLDSALLFADEAKRLEDFINKEGSQEDDDIDVKIDARLPIGNRHDSFVIYSIISTISFLEATINEFYDRHQSIAEIRSEDEFEEKLEKERNVSSTKFYDMVDDMNRINDRNFEYNPVLEKYQYLLTFAGESIFDTGKEPFQNIALIRNFRNSLVHAKTKWIHLSDEEMHQIGKSLRGKFEPNPFGESLPFPRQYLSFDCSKWCIESSLEFVEEFHDRMGTRPPMHIRNRRENLWNPDSLITVEIAEE